MACYRILGKFSLSKMRRLYGRAWVDWHGVTDRCKFLHRCCKLLVLTLDRKSGFILSPFGASIYFMNYHVLGRISLWSIVYLGAQCCGMLKFAVGSLRQVLKSAQQVFSCETGLRASSRLHGFSWVGDPFCSEIVDCKPLNDLYYWQSRILLILIDQVY